MSHFYKLQNGLEPIINNKDVVMLNICVYYQSIKN